MRQLLIFLLASAGPLLAQVPSSPKPADCLVTDPRDAVAAAEYGGKTYHFNSAACKDEFLTDPERYSQLYDALLELRAKGQLAKAKPRDEASLVPS